MLNTSHGHCKHLMGSRSSFAYCMLMKFLVAPESRSTVVLALFCDRWMNIRNCIDFCIEKYILSDSTLNRLGLRKISLLGSHSCHQFFLVFFWECVQLLIDGINCGCSWVAFIVFWAPVNKLGCACVGVLLFGRAIASEVSLFSAIKTHTLYPSLESSIFDSGYISPLWTSSLASPVSPWCSGSVEVHWDQLIISCLQCSGGIEWSLSESLSLGLLALIALEALSLCLPCCLEIGSWRGASRWLFVQCVDDALRGSDTDCLFLHLFVCLNCCVFKDLLTDTLR